VAAEFSTPAFRPRAISIVVLGGVFAAAVGPEAARHARYMFPGAEFAGSFLVLCILFCIQLVVVMVIDYKLLARLTAAAGAVVEGGGAGGMKGPAGAGDANSHVAGVLSSRRGAKGAVGSTGSNTQSMARAGDAGDMDGTGSSLGSVGAVGSTRSQAPHASQVPAAADVIAGEGALLGVADVVSVKNEGVGSVGLAESRVDQRAIAGGAEAAGSCGKDGGDALLVDGCSSSGTSDGLLGETGPHQLSRQWVISGAAEASGLGGQQADLETSR